MLGGDGVGAFQPETYRSLLVQGLQAVEDHTGAHRVPDESHRPRALMRRDNPERGVDTSDRCDVGTRTMKSSDDIPVVARRGRQPGFDPPPWHAPGSGPCTCNQRHPRCQIWGRLECLTWLAGTDQGLSSLEAASSRVMGRAAAEVRPRRAECLITSSIAYRDASLHTNSRMPAVGRKHGGG